MCTFDRYPEYDILADPDVAKTAAVSTRYSDSSLNGIILDIHFLSLCDYLVCTFSSQVSTRHPSLDYYVHSLCFPEPRFAACYKMVVWIIRYGSSQSFAIISVKIVNIW